MPIEVAIAAAIAGGYIGAILTTAAREGVDFAKEKYK